MTDMEVVAEQLEEELEGVPPGRAELAELAAPDSFLDTEGVLRVRCKVWELPVRLTHWAIVAAITVLSITGLYIASPIIGVGSGSAFLMGKVRAVHIVAGWVLLTAWAARLAWGFMGNHYSRWHQFIPTTRERFTQMKETLAFYLLRPGQRHPVVGHNPLAGLAYFAVFVVVGFQLLSGFALENLATRDGLMWSLTGWIFDVFPIPTVRLFHHLGMYLLLGFTIHHVYSVALMDHEERSGLFSSMITGYKHLPCHLVRRDKGRK